MYSQYYTQEREENPDLEISTEQLDSEVAKVISGYEPSDSVDTTILEIQQTANIEDLDPEVLQRTSAVHSHPGLLTSLYNTIDSFSKSASSHRNQGVDIVEDRGQGSPYLHKILRTRDRLSQDPKFTQVYKAKQKTLKRRMEKDLSATKTLLEEMVAETSSPPSFMTAISDKNGTKTRLRSGKVIVREDSLSQEDLVGNLSGLPEGNLDDTDIEDLKRQIKEIRQEDLDTQNSGEDLSIPEAQDGLSNKSPIRCLSPVGRSLELPRDNSPDREATQPRTKVGPCSTRKTEKSTVKKLLDPILSTKDDKKLRWLKEYRDDQNLLKCFLESPSREKKADYLHLLAESKFTPQQVALISIISENQQNITGELVKQEVAISSLEERVVSLEEEIKQTQKIKGEEIQAVVSTALINVATDMKSVAAYSQRILNKLEQLEKKKPLPERVVPTSASQKSEIPPIVPIKEKEKGKEEDKDCSEIKKITGDLTVKEIPAAMWAKLKRSGYTVGQVKNCLQGTSGIISKLSTSAAPPQISVPVPVLTSPEESTTTDSEFSMPCPESKNYSTLKTVTNKKTKTYQYLTKTTRDDISKELGCIKQSSWEEMRDLLLNMKSKGSTKTEIKRKWEWWLDVNFKKEYPKIYIALRQQSGVDTMIAMLEELEEMYTES